MTGKQYADLIASYIVRNYGGRGLLAYREVTLGKTIIAKNRKVDILLIQEATNQALAIECKYQEGPGTTDEKIPYTLQDIPAMPVPGCIVYAGGGFSPGVVHMREASRFAARCLPPPDLTPNLDTWQLDHLLAVSFCWWDIVVRGRQPHRV